MLDARAERRKLLVVSPDDDAEELMAGLAAQGWDPQLACDTQRAEALRQEHDPLVALALWNRSRDPHQLAELRRAVLALPKLRWVAIFTHDQLDLGPVQRLVTDRLYDFHTCPVDMTRLSFALGHAYGMASLAKRLQRGALGEKSLRTGRFGLIGDGSEMEQVFRAIERASDADATVLITGPTGTGKELVARAIHAASARADGPFVAVNCAAIPATLLSAELFGHEKGAFTGADQRKMGHIEAAAGGTLLLDEIGELPLESQSLLLRFLEDKRVTRLGGRRSEPVDVRVLATTNRDLEQRVREGDFRSDLFYRLSVVTIRTPALKGRDRDIDLLAEHFLAEGARSAKVTNIELSQDARDYLHSLDWPGNVRELRTRIFRAVAVCEGPVVTAADLDRSGPAATGPSACLKDIRVLTEREALENTLGRNRWNVSRSARDLGISRMTLYRLLDKHGLSRTRSAHRHRGSGPHRSD